MSMGEIQQVHEMLIKIDALLTSIETKTESVDKKTKSISGRGSELKEVEYIFYRVTSLMRRMGLPEDVNKAITTLQHAILTVRILTTAIYYLQATTPYGQLMAIVGLATFAFTVVDTIGYATRGT
jgi:hypothetical protein